MDKMDLEKELYALEMSHIHPGTRISREKLGGVLDDSFFEFGSSGAV